MKEFFLVSLLLVFFSAVFSSEAAAYPQFLGNKVVCPVSGEIFNVEPDSEKASYKGKVYFFCRADCAARFNADQKKYLQGAEEKKRPERKGE